MTRSASCLCGQLSVNVTGEPERMNMCNCSACQRRSGSAFQIGAWFRDERVTAINVTVTFEKAGARVEILVDAEHKHNFVANDIGDDVIPTFDVTLHKMEQQIKKYKEKIQDHRRDLPEKGTIPGE